LKSIDKHECEMWLAHRKYAGRAYRFTKCTVWRFPILNDCFGTNFTRISHQNSNHVKVCSSWSKLW